VEITGRLAIVTGGGSGLGLVLCNGLARAGARVLVADRDADAAQRVTDDLGAEGLQAVACPVDITDDQECEKLVARAVELGGPHILVNNAGGWIPGSGQFPDAEPAAWTAGLDLNLRAPMLLTQLCRPVMTSLGGGVVIMVASSAGIEHGRYGSPEYATSKAGIIRFTTALGSGPDPGAQRIACVVPGWIGLPRADDELAALPPAKRAATPPLIPPEDVVAVVLDLLADDTASGSVVALEGGRPPRRLF
jgi:NAD(P)-dependent dehydrogenase (short-subunit alcohol dehydrogenase family)